MRAYLKSKTDFSTYKAVDVLEEDIVLHSTDDAQSSATLMGALDLQLGDYLVYGDWLGVLHDSEPESGTTDVKLSPFLTIFDREILFSLPQADQVTGNLYTLKGAVDGALITSTGSVDTSFANFYATDYIALPAGTTSVSLTQYYTTTGGYNAWYNADKEFISAFQKSAGTSTLTPPDGARYMRLTQSKLSEADGLILTANYYGDVIPDSTEAFLMSVIEDNFINQTDEAYRIPYIEVSTATSTPYVAPEMDEDEKLFSVYEYINYVRSLKGVYVDVAFDNDSINITIERHPLVSHNIIFGSMGYELVSENYSNKVTSKVTAIANGVATNYYLMEDGTTTTDPSSGTRVVGEWQTFVINQSESELEKEDAAEKLAEKVSDKVASIFSKNSRSHCIEFLGTRKLGFGDTLLLKMHGKIFTSSVSQIIKASGDSRYRYKSGELKVTLTEKLTEVLK